MQQRKTSSYNTAIGENVKAVRVRLGITQAQCAGRMRELGFDWHQQTAGSVERATRRVTAEEVMGLSLALECAFADLLAPGTDTGTIVLPDGEQLPAHSVRRMALSIYDGVVRWDDTKPVIRQGPPPPLRSEDVRSKLDEMNMFLEEVRRLHEDRQQEGGAGAEDRNG